MAKQDNKSIFTEWLEKLQQESWQLELLISGLALFGIYESQDLLLEFRLYVQDNSEGLVRITQNFFLSILSIGWKIFFINLLVHVILRGLWIGAIGLRYVSQDIEYGSLNYSKYFTELLQRRVGKFDDFIERLEKICSVLFAYTFLLFLLFFSIGFFFFQILVIALLTNDLGPEQALATAVFMILYLFLGFIVFIDFITLGLFKKIEEKSVNRIYSYIFTFYGWVTLTFLYRPLLYNFLDNRYTKRLFYLSIPYFMIILLASKMFSNNNFVYFPPDSNAQQFGNTINRMNYEDLRRAYLTEKDFSIDRRRQSIPDIVLNKYMNNEDYLQIFLKMNPSDYISIQKNTDIEPYWKIGLNFTLFSSEANRDKFYSEGNKKLEIEFDTLRIIRRTLRKSKRQIKDSTKLNVINAQIDSINNYMLDKRQAFNEKGILFEEEKQKRSIQALLDLVTLEIDSTNAKSNLDCYFFQYPNNNEKGLMCLYPMDSLDMGKHFVTYCKKQISSHSKKTKIINLKLPFYKVSDFGDN